MIARSRLVLQLAEIIFVLLEAHRISFLFIRFFVITIMLKKYDVYINTKVYIIFINIFDIETFQ